MAIHTEPTTTTRILLSREIDELLLHLRGLIVVRELLAARGATRAEIDAHTVEIESRRRRLAKLVGKRAAPESAFGEAA